MGTGRDKRHTITVHTLNDLRVALSHAKTAQTRSTGGAFGAPLTLHSVNVINADIAVGIAS